MAILSIIYFASWPNVQNSMVCAIHKFKKRCCKCHRVGRFHETFKRKRSRGAHKGNLHTMLTCTLRSQHCMCIANNSKYSQGLLHIHAFNWFICCVFVHLYISIHLKSVSKWMHAPWVSIAQSLHSSQERRFFLLLGRAFFNPRFFPQMNENCNQLQKCTAATVAQGCAASLRN